MVWQEHIESNPTIMHGAACIKGTRIPASVVLDNLAEGMTPDQVIQEYPSLTHEAIHAALAYAAALARERVIDMPA